MSPLTSSLPSQVIAKRHASFFPSVVGAHARKAITSFVNACSLSPSLHRPSRQLILLTDVPESAATTAPPPSDSKPSAGEALAVFSLAPLSSSRHMSAPSMLAAAAGPLDASSSTVRKQAEQI
jgi:hypothetical protein